MKESGGRFGGCIFEDFSASFNIVSCGFK
jgi:hypothetical protein